MIMDLTTRLAVVVVLLVAGALVTVWYRRRSARDEAVGTVDEVGASLWPDVDPELRSALGPVAHEPAHQPAPTWVIFTTPLCVSCNAVQADLERSFPHHAVHKLDATERPDLADRYGVRRAPTTILADTNGRVVERLVGPEAVREFIGAIDDPALLS